MFTGTYPHVSGHRSLENLIKPWEPNMFRSLKEAGYHVGCLAPRGDTFAPTVTELSVNEYRFLETPEFVPKFGSGKGGENDESIWGRLLYRGLRDADRMMDYDDAVVRSAITWSRLDDQFGRLIKAIEDHGYWDSTVTMFFTDHGEYLSDHGLIEK